MSRLIKLRFGGRADAAVAEVVEVEMPVRGERKESVGSSSKAVKLLSAVGTQLEDFVVQAE